MKVKAKQRTLLDLTMTVLLLAVMAYQITGNLLHEWMGVILFMLFAVHHVFNLGWYKNVMKGRYTKIRILSVIMGFLLLLSISGMIVSGVMISQNVFGFFNVKTGNIWHKLHMTSAAWGYVLMSAHLGMHFGMVARKTESVVTKALAVRPTYICRTVFVVFSVYGICAFQFRQIGQKMLFLLDYAFYDYKESAALFFMDYVSIMALFTGVFYYGVKRLKK